MLYSRYVGDSELVAEERSSSPLAGIGNEVSCVEDLLAMGMLVLLCGGYSIGTGLY